MRFLYCAAYSKVTQQLRHLGFAEEDVSAAMAQGGTAPSTAAALDWLCLHVPHERLPARFAAGQIQLLRPVSM